MRRTVILVLMVLSAIAADVVAAATPDAHSPSNLRFGVGFGIPYGLVGANLEASPIKYVGLSGGAGFTPGGIGWAIGARLYPLGNNNDFNPRISYFHGVVAIAEESAYNSSRKTYKNLTGNAYGIGLTIKDGKDRDFDIDLIFPQVSLSKGYERKDGDSDVKISIGYGIRF